MRKAFCVGVLLMSGLCCFGQSNISDATLDEILSDKEVMQWQGQLDTRNKSYIGKPYQHSFKLKTTNNRVIDNSALAGKVTVLFFGRENSFNLKDISDLNERFKKNPSFQLLYVTVDNKNVDQLTNKYNFPFSYAPRASAKSMNFNNDFPSYVIINKAGIVTDVFAGYKKNFKDCCVSMIDQLLKKS